MKNNRNMKGFKSLRALYLFEKGEKLESLANELEEKTCVNTNQENSQESSEIKQKPVRILRKFK